MLNSDHELFFFKEGYLRTSSSEFGIDLQNIDDAFIHLTNDAVQKNAVNYGDFEDANKLSFPQFQKYIDEFYPDKGITIESIKIELADGRECNQIPLKTLTKT